MKKANKKTTKKYITSTLKLKQEI